MFGQAHSTEQTCPLMLTGGGPSFTPSHALPPHVQWGHSYHHPTVSQNFITHMHGAGTSGSNMPQRPIVSVHNLSMPLQSVVFTSPLWIGAEQLYNRYSHANDSIEFPHEDPQYY